MDAMSSRKTKPSNILSAMQSLAPDVTFVPKDSFYWSPQQRTIAFNETSLNQTEGTWSLLHETAHAILNHHIYKNDFDLLLMEVAAWKQAKEIAAQLDIDVNEDHVQDCLDTYRDWLHRRSTCPTCGNVGLQHSSSEYRCHNCHTTWHVTTARFCRPYRKKQISGKEKSPGPDKDQTTFR